MYYLVFRMVLNYSNVLINCYLNVQWFYQIIQFILNSITVDRRTSLYKDHMKKIED